MHNSSVINLFYVPMLYDRLFDGLIYREYCHELPQTLQGRKWNLYLQVEVIPAVSGERKMLLKSNKTNPSLANCLNIGIEDNFTFPWKPVKISHISIYL